MCLKKLSLLFLFLFALQLSNAQSHRVINIPDIPGYQTLKCDFHMHTVFSDGTVWPTIRVEEAWQEGLDAIAITDHIEYLPHSKDIVADHNRSFDIAEPISKAKDIILVKGAEITRSMPPGHLNALFITNANLLDRDDVMDAIKEARDQGAFLVWNHPGWKKQQPDTTLWWDEHTELLKNDLLHGIEVFNSTSYYPEALDWANEKKLTILCNTDVHGPIGMSYNVIENHRPLTLVFSRSRTSGGIREALFSRRTAAYFGNTLIGEARFLEPLFFASLDYKNIPLKIDNNTSNTIQIKNNSDVNYEMELLQPGVGFDVPEKITLMAHQITSLLISGNSDEVKQMENLNVYYEIKNMKTTSTENLVVTFSFKNN